MVGTSSPWRTIHTDTMYGSTSPRPYGTVSSIFANELHESPVFSRTLGT